MALRRALPFLVLAGAILCLFPQVFPWDSDAAFANIDAMTYGWEMEHGGAAYLRSHHLLYHATALILIPPLSMLGAEHPGFMAIRIIAALGLALLVLVLGWAGGWQRRTMLLLFPLIATREVFMATAVGETLLPAATFSVLTLVLAWREQVPLLHVGVAFVMACLLRQDSILILPGMLVALRLRTHHAPAWPQIVRHVALMGTIALALYALAWWVSGTPSFTGWLLEIAQRAGRHWAPADPPAAHLLQLRGMALGAAVAGVQSAWDAPLLNTAIGALFLLLLAGIGWFCGAGRWPRAMILSVLAAVGVRTAFYLWFEPQNPEWWITDLALLAAAVVVKCAARPPRAPYAALGLCVIVVVSLLLLHGSCILRLREGTLRELGSTGAAWSQGTDKPIVVSLGIRPFFALASHGVEANARVLEGAPDLKTIHARLDSLRKQSKRAVLLAVDRNVGEGQPVPSWWQSDATELTALDQITPPPGCRVHRIHGRIQLILFPALP